jgi:hypothetical protein
MIKSEGADILLIRSVWAIRSDLRRFFIEALRFGMGIGADLASERGITYLLTSYGNGSDHHQSELRQAIEAFAAATPDEQQVILQQAESVIFPPPSLRIVGPDADPVPQIMDTDTTDVHSVLTIDGTSAGGQSDLLVDPSVGTFDTNARTISTIAGTFTTATSNTSGTSSSSDSATAPAVAGNVAESATVVEEDSKPAAKKDSKPPAKRPRVD